MIQIAVSEREAATLIGALHMYDCEAHGASAASPRLLLSMVTGAGTLFPLQRPEIEELMFRIGRAERIDTHGQDQADGP